MRDNKKIQKNSQQLPMKSGLVWPYAIWIQHIRRTKLSSWSKKKKLQIVRISAQPNNQSQIV